jgi:amino acid permease
VKLEIDSHVSCINAFVVKWYGEAEFWLALGKVLLIFIVYMFTFITMVRTPMYELHVRHTLTSYTNILGGRKSEERRIWLPLL